MTADRFVYKRGARLPGLTLYWDDADGNPIDFTSVAHTFAATLTSDDGLTEITVSGSLTGNNGNVTVAWSATDLDHGAGLYRLRLRATESASTKPRDYSPDFPPIIQIVED